MCQVLSTPTQVSTSKNHQRCEHGYYLNARQLNAPVCRTCDPAAYPLTKDETSYALALLALRRTETRPKGQNGQFEAEATVSPGHYRCWRCKEVKPLDERHFRRAASKATGFQTRCIPCDNRRKTSRRRGEQRPGVQALLDVGVVL